VANHRPSRRVSTIAANALHYRFAMPIHYERDDLRRRILTVSRGQVTYRETAAVIDRQAAEGAWSYSMLYDTRAAAAVPTSEEVNRLVQHVGALTTKYGPRGPVALVVADPDLLDMGQRYARLGHLTSMAVGLFLTIEDAERWLLEAH
jgi:hypothetical protein